MDASSYPSAKEAVEHLSTAVWYLGSTGAQVWSAIVVYIMLLIRDANATYAAGRDDARREFAGELEWMARLRNETTELFRRIPEVTEEELRHMRVYNGAFEAVVTKLATVSKEDAKYAMEVMSGKPYPGGFDVHHAEYIKHKSDVRKDRHRKSQHHDKVRDCLTAIAINLGVLLVHALVEPPRWGMQLEIGVIAVVDVWALVACWRVARSDRSSPRTTAAHSVSP